jgi:hypothetical protein
MTYLAIFALVLVSSIGFALLSFASEKDDIDNHTDFH